MVNLAIEALRREGEGPMTMQGNCHDVSNMLLRHLGDREGVRLLYIASMFPDNVNVLVECIPEDWAQTFNPREYKEAG